MPKRSESFANTVRKIVVAADRDVTVPDIAILLDMISEKEKRRIRHALYDMRKTGEVVRVKQGFYRYVGKSKRSEYREIMWRILRARRSVTIDDLVEMSGASRKYVREWLCMLTIREIVRRHKNGKYQLIKDPVKMPSDGDKKSSLSEIACQKEDSFRKTGCCLVAINEARMAVTGIEEVDDETV